MLIFKKRIFKTLVGKLSKTFTLTFNKSWTIGADPNNGKKLIKSST